MQDMPGTRDTDLVGMLVVEITLLTSTWKLPLWRQRGTRALEKVGRASSRVAGEKCILICSKWIGCAFGKKYLQFFPRL